MNCLPNQITQRVSGSSPVVVSLIASETTIVSGRTGNFTNGELAFEAEMTQRAEVITNVLAKIMEQPSAFRHWGLNE